MRRREDVALLEAIALKTACMKIRTCRSTTGQQRSWFNNISQRILHECSATGIHMLIMCQNCAASLGRVNATSASFISRTIQELDGSGEIGLICI